MLKGLRHIAFRGSIILGIIVIIILMYPSKSSAKTSRVINYDNQVLILASGGMPVLGLFKINSNEIFYTLGFEYHFKMRSRVTPIRFWVGMDIWSFFVFPSAETTNKYSVITKTFYTNLPSFNLNLNLGYKIKKIIPYLALKGGVMTVFPDQLDRYTGSPFKLQFYPNITTTLGLRLASKFSFNVYADYMPFATLFTKVDNQFSLGNENTSLVENNLSINAGVAYVIKSYTQEEKFEKGLKRTHNLLNDFLSKATTINTVFAFEDQFNDQDQDGIRNEFDECPETPRGATVDEIGCMADSDNDGVVDYLDKCNNTPIGKRINNVGCPDDDLDGVPDYKDECDETPVGEVVNQFGCPVKNTDGLSNIKDFTVLKQFTINFNITNMGITQDGEKIIKDISNQIKSMTGSRWIIRGHTHRIGSETSEALISKNLVNKVIARFNLYGVSRTTFIRTDLVGSKELVSTSEDDEGMKVNLRVEVILTQ